MEPFNIAVVGATGYTGSELLRILIGHPGVSIKALTSNTHAGRQLTEIHPQYQGIFDIRLTAMEDLDLDELDLILLALPHGVSMDFVRRTGYEKCKIVDLSGDFRLSSAEIYEKWYGKKHEYPQGIQDAVYGMPELNRERIRGARLIANPGCFPTSAILPLVPLVAEGLINPSTIVIDSKSGVTGAGAKPKLNTHFPNASENFSAYGLKNHRHTPEIGEVVNLHTGIETRLIFTPHLLPVNRGILSTLYSEAIRPVTDEELRSVYRKYYAGEPFIRLVDAPPGLQQVRGTNYCDIYSTYDERTGRILTISVIDNLVKGAAGQAVQNMNLALGISETDGLTLMPSMP